ncbi:MAG: glucose-1-phosphate adenylyltransferase [Rhodothermales bacterium]|nr:glucose-1-phosphate adenylyltransferase [Rhodothermales bacterium]MDG2017754.1 glucose-1-phosphate adenylyltransferase [Rhodothermales bacterium]
MISIILGGGAGSRLFPLTHHRSKPAVPLAGKYRLIDIPVSNCINSDINQIFVVTQYNSASLNRHISQTYRFDKFRHGFVNILAAEQTPFSKEWFQGTADAVRQSMQHVQHYRHDEVLILSGDQLYTMDYQKMLAHHRATNADVTIASIPVDASDAPGFGILKTNSEGLITEFYEKPDVEDLEGKSSSVSDEMEQQGRIYLASMGIYIFSAKVLKELFERHQDAHDFGKEIIPSALSSHRVASYAFEGYWSDIGTIKSFFDANLMLTRPRPDFDLYNPEMPIYTNARMLQPAKFQHSRVNHSIIAEASVIGKSRITNSVIGLRSFIGDDVELDETVVMGNDYFRWHDPADRILMDGPDQPGIGDGTKIRRTIVDRNASIGKDCKILNETGYDHFDGDGYFIRDGIVVIPKNCQIPDGTII